MITCTNCKFKDKTSCPGGMSELRYIRVMDTTQYNGNKKFLCGIDCYTNYRVKREFGYDPEDSDEAKFEEYLEERFPELKKDLLEDQDIQRFFERNGLDRNGEEPRGV